jgi:membrane fusion protein, multidrug efflux system
MADEPSVHELNQRVEPLEEEQKKPKEGQDGDQAPQKKESQPTTPPPDKPKKPAAKRARRYVKRHPGRVLLGALVLAVVIAGGVLLWNHLSSYEDTDDAQVDGHLIMLSPRISGTVVGVYAENNQYVQSGQVIVDLDPRDYEVALQHAQAAYEQAIAQLHAESPNVPIVVTTNQTTISEGEAAVVVAEKAVAAAQQAYQARLADQRNAEAQNAKAQRDVERYAPLVAKEEVSRQQFDAVRATAESDAASVDAARAAVEVSLRDLDERGAELLQAQTRLQGAQQNAPRQTASRQAAVQTRQADISAAKAVVDQATLNLSYTKIVAPVSGVVANKTVELGERLEPGQDMLDISQVDDIWITANFKETQLKRMRPGQSVDVHVDALGQTFHGYIEAMPGATGAVTSLLPPENATGNYVKVVQRLPVRIRLKPGEDRGHRLRIGMSVEPKVWLNSNR